MDAVVHYGTPLIDDPNRINDVTAIGLDEVLFCRSRPFKRRAWSTQVVDVARGQLLDIAPGRHAASTRAWFTALDGNSRRLLRQCRDRAILGPNANRAPRPEAMVHRTRVELVNALFEYLEIFHNRQRRHSSIGMLTPIEFENQHHTRTA
jgi:transposase InsO family protein